MLTMLTMLTVFVKVKTMKLVFAASSLSTQE
jgi:hypothetical protein